MTWEQCSEAQDQRLLFVCEDPRIFQVGLASMSKSLAEPKIDRRPLEGTAYKIKFIAQVGLFYFGSILRNRRNMLHEKESGVCVLG